MLASLEAFGLPAEQLSEIRREIEGRCEPFAVWPENEQAVEVFLACSTQWRFLAGMGGTRCLGLDYALLAASMRLMRVRAKRQPAVFAAIQVMEVAALAEISRAA